MSAPKQTAPTAEDELLDAAAHAILRSLMDEANNNQAAAGEDVPRHLQAQIHDNQYTEQNADDSAGLQGGQLYSDPTKVPTAAPTTYPPSRSPTAQPTLRGKEFIVRGKMYYDRNGNGTKDSNVRVPGMGDDVEYERVVGGVSVTLVRCDPDTGRKYEGSDDLSVTTMTSGFDATMKPQIVREQGEVGKFNMRVKGLEMYYYVEAKAPEGYAFTSGMCNPALDDVSDSMSPFKCKYDEAVEPLEEGRRARFLTGREELAWRGRRAQAAHSKGNGSANAQGQGQGTAPGQVEEEAVEEVSYGFREGRSNQCVYVDKYGVVSESLEFGVMRLGDTQEVGTNVALVLEFDESGTTATPGRRSLAQMLQTARLLDEVDDGATVTTRYLLGDEDKRAIGTVTAEVLAATLDGRLAREGVELDSVNPKEVILSSSRPSDNSAAPGAAGNQLAVAMEIRGHYSPPPAIDFDYIVQDSINRDTATIRRGLREYNRNCRDQTSKVTEQGLKETDFNAVVSTNGAARPGRGGGRPVDFNQMNGNVFSTACDSELLVPEYFETSLKEIEARELADVRFADRDSMTYVAEESRGLDAWAVGPVAGIAGLIVLLAGAFVFRRALGPRRVDAFADKTKEVDAEEMRRFGEAGGDMDDGSVDSAFYSDDDELEETEKEKRMRRKRKEKGDEQHSKSTRASRKKRDALGELVKEETKMSTTSSSSRKKRDGVRSSRVEKALAISHGSDDTESLERSSSSINSSSSSPDDFAENNKAEKSRERKRAAKERASLRASQSRRSTTSKKRDEGHRRSERRGRSKRSGGDNAKAIDEKLV